MHLLYHIPKHLRNISTYANGFLFEFFRTKCFIKIDASINRIWIFRSYLPERILDDNRSIESYSKFQKQHMHPLVTAQKISVSFSCFVPTLVLHEFIILHADSLFIRLAAFRTLWYKLKWNTHIFLFIVHSSDKFFVIKSFLTARL